ncbi:hypothetical protein GCM10023192_11420 [Amycolatopsis samaneae]
MPGGFAWGDSGGLAPGDADGDPDGAVEGDALPLGAAAPSLVAGFAVVV